MPNEVSSNTMTTAVTNNLLVQDTSLYPYLMQYQFIGSSMTPSFSNIQQVPVDIRFTRYSVVKHGNRYIEESVDFRYFLQIRGAWESYPLEKHNFRERHYYHSASFGFFHQKANKNIYRVPDFTIQLSKVVVVLKRDLVEGTFLNPNQQSGEISFDYQHRHCHGNFPLHIIQRTFSPEEPW